MKKVLILSATLGFMAGIDGVRGGSPRAEAQASPGCIQTCVDHFRELQSDADTPEEHAAASEFLRNCVDKCTPGDPD
jgi:hypothetical protein